MIVSGIFSLKLKNIENSMPQKVDFGQFFTAIFVVTECTFHIKNREFWHFFKSIGYKNSDEAKNCLLLKPR